MYEVGIIGIGRIGFLLEFDEFREKPCTHSGAYENHPDFKVTAVCDIDIENLTKYKKYSSNNEVLTYTDYNLMLVENKFDVISIATWTDTHEEIFYKCVDSKRVKLIFLEKPISLSYKRSEKMIKYAKLNNVYVVVDFERK
jgi:predicted dehydrogenase